MFEKAARQKLRFDSAKGQLSVEDLWDLPLTSARGVSLDAIAIALDTDLKTQNVSFVTDVTPRNTETQLKFDIVKHIIDVRKAENAERAASAAKAEKKQKLLEALARRQNEAVESMSEDEIKAALAEL